MNTVNSVLRILSDGRFHSGSALGETLSVSRAAVWKAVQKLQQEWQVKINAVPGRGYQLAASLTLLDKNTILAAIAPQTKSRLQEIQVLWSVDSTNRYISNQASNGVVPGLAVLAEHQSAGRGRRGRHWVSPFGRNLYLSLLWEFELDAAQLSGLSLAIAVAITRALTKLEINDVMLKWPNDLLWHERKLCGVLLEMKGEACGPWQVVIGIGLNVNMDSITTEEIGQPWVDLKSILGRNLDRNQLAALILSELLQAMEQFQQSGLSPFIAEWRARDVCRDQLVELHFPDRVQQGIARGIDNTGALLMESDGVVKSYHAGEVSLRY
jgi:BirA family biotin operon repressor/biotin-[acetyl-CoA-carboxylase] ligase